MKLMFLGVLLAVCCLTNLEPVYAAGGLSVELVSFGWEKMAALVVRAAGNLEVRTRIDGVWGAWLNLGGECTSPVSAVSWGENRIDVFVRWTDKSVRHKWFVDGVGWSDWESLAGLLPYDYKIGTVSHASNRMTIFVLAGGGTIQYQHWGGSSWSGWTSLQGIGTSGVIATSYKPGYIAMFSRGTEYRVWYRIWKVNDGINGWEYWANLGYQSVDEFGVASYAQGRIDVFARSRVGYNILHQWFTMGEWADSWEDVGGHFNTGPVVISQKGYELAVFARDTNNDVLSRILQWDGWTGWINRGGKGTGSLATAANNIIQGKVDVAFATSTDVQYMHNLGDWTSI